MFTFIKFLSVVPLIFASVYFYLSWYYSITIEVPDKTYDFMIGKYDTVQIDDICNFA